MTAAPLPSRADAIISAIPATSRAYADIGYDLGQISAAALSARPALRVIGVEIQPDAAARTEAHLRERGLSPDRLSRFERRTGDGLRPLSPGEVDGALLAGIGERTVLDILKAAPAVVASLEWLLFCPPHLEADLRPTLRALGWHPKTVAIAADRGRYYELILARREVDPTQGIPDADPVADLWGPELLSALPRDTARAFVEDAAQRFDKALRADLRAYGPGSGKARMGQKLALIPTLLGRLAAPS